MIITGDIKNLSQETRHTNEIKDKRDVTFYGDFNIINENIIKEIDVQLEFHMYFVEICM